MKFDQVNPKQFVCKIFESSGIFLYEKQDIGFCKQTLQTRTSCVLFQLAVGRSVRTPMVSLRHQTTRRTIRRIATVSTTFTPHTLVTDLNIHNAQII